MEIKHTIEILTKDIQDIEKLVGNLQNSEDGYAIELDLALSKLRSVYDILTMIKADRWNEMVSQPDEAAESLEAEKEPEQEPEPEPEQATETEQEPEPEQATEPEQEPELEAELEAGSEQATEPEQEPEPELEAGSEQEAEQEADPEQAPEHTSAVTSEKKKDAEILAEKFSAESSINENLAGQRGKDMDTKLIGKPIDSISRNIGINDRFLIIRELLNGDSDRFINLMKSLERAGNYHDAISLLEEEFSGSSEHEGVEILAGLVKRRYTRE